MALSVSRAAVKEKAGITVTTYDTPIDNLLTTWLAALTFAIADEHIADTGNAGLQATLNLAAAEMIAGEILAQIDREPGARDRFRLADLSVERDDLGPGDPSGLKAQGLARLRPFLKADSGLIASATGGVQVGGGSKGGQDPLVAE